MMYIVLHLKGWKIVRTHITDCPCCLFCSTLFKDNGSWLWWTWILMLRKSFRNRNNNKKPGPRLWSLGIYCKLKLILLQFEFWKPIWRNFCLKIRRSVAQFLRQLYFGCRLYQNVAYIKGCKNDLPWLSLPMVSMSLKFSKFWSALEQSLKQLL